MLEIVVNHPVYLRTSSLFAVRRRHMVCKGVRRVVTSISVVIVFVFVVVVVAVYKSIVCCVHNLAGGSVRGRDFVL